MKLKMASMSLSSPVHLMVLLFMSYAHMPVWSASPVLVPRSSFFVWVPWPMVDRHLSLSLSSLLWRGWHDRRLDPSLLFGYLD